jgi:prepilin-type N-terminal cleavage/methylation domain-containing protein
MKQRVVGRRRRLAPEQRVAFTLVELLVVIAIIGVLIGLLLPAVQAAREAARRSACSNNMKNLCLAMLNHHDQKQAFPYGFNWLEALWQAPLLPYIEEQPLYDTLIFHESNGNWGTNGSPNETACGTVISLFRCPSLSAPDHIDNEGIPLRVPVSYRGCAGSNIFSDDRSTITNAPAGAMSLEEVPLDGMLWGESKVRIHEVTDGTSKTVILGESAFDLDYVKDGQAMDYWQLGSPQTGGWSSGGAGGTEYSEGVGAMGPKINSRFDPTIDGRHMEIAFGSWHPQGAAFGFVDGSTRFINNEIAIDVYRALGSRNGGEVTGAVD